MSFDDKDYVILRTFGNVWKIDRKIYSVEGLKLLMPVTPNELLYFAVSMVISIMLIKVVPFYKNLHFFIKFVIVPFGLMKFFTKQKLDGKMPLKFFYDYIVYKLGPKRYARFKPVQQPGRLRFTTCIVYRGRRIVNRTDLAMRKAKAAKGRRVAP